MQPRNRAIRKSSPSGSPRRKPARRPGEPPTAGHARVGAVDLLAFIGVLVLVGVLTLLVDRTGQLSARLAFAGAAGLVVGGVTAWRRLRRPALRRWRSGQAIYRGRRVTVVSAWGVEGQPLPAIEPSATASTIPTATASTTPTAPATASTTPTATASTTPTAPATV